MIDAITTSPRAASEAAMADSTHNASGFEAAVHREISGWHGIGTKLEGDVTPQGLLSANGTWFHALQTVTYAVDHVAGRGTPETRFHSATFGAGNDRKSRGLALALARAAA